MVLQQYRPDLDQSAVLDFLTACIHIPRLWQAGRYTSTEAKFKEFKPRLKYGWFHLKLYYIFQDLSRRSIETGFGGIRDAA